MAKPQSAAIIGTVGWVYSRLTTSRRRCQAHTLFQLVTGTWLQNGRSSPRRIIPQNTPQRGSIHRVTRGPIHKPLPLVSSCSSLCRLPLDAIAITSLPLRTPPSASMLWPCSAAACTATLLHSERGGLQDCSFDVVSWLEKEITSRSCERVLSSHLSCLRRRFPI